MKPHVNVGIIGSVSPKFLAMSVAGRIAALEGNRAPYTVEQLMNLPYRGTAHERADRDAGGPELRRQISEESKKCFVIEPPSDMIPPPVPPLALVPSDSPILRQRCREVRQDELPELKDPKFLYRLDKFRRQLKGVGLAAPQIGDSRQYFVWQEHTHSDKGELVINPKVTWRIGATHTTEEGCLSFPGKQVPVERPLEIDVEYTSSFGSFRQRRLHYRAARIFLHEFDHLQGTCIF